MRILRTLAPHLVVLAAFAGYAVYFRVPTHSIRSGPDEYRRIERGMTREQVHNVLGGPYGHHCSDPMHQINFASVAGESSYYFSMHAHGWKTDEGEIRILFEQDRVTAMAFQNVRPPRSWPMRHLMAVLLCVGLIAAIGLSQLADRLHPPLDSPATPPPAA